jgi:hypothetical protein
MRTSCQLWLRRSKAAALLWMMIPSSSLSTEEMSPLSSNVLPATTAEVTSMARTPELDSMDARPLPRSTASTLCTDFSASVFASSSHQKEPVTNE